MEKFRKEFKKNFPDNKSIAVVAKEGGAKWKAIPKVAKEGGAKWKAKSESEKTPYVEKAASKKAEYEDSLKNKEEVLSSHEEMISYYLNYGEELNSNESAGSSSKPEMTMLEILEFYATHHKFSIPRKVLIDESFCRYMLRKNITIEAIRDFLLTKDVQLNVTSCSTKPLMRGKIHNKDELKARIGLALSLKELSCDDINTCLNPSDCLERLVINENQNCYFVATKDEDIMKNMLELPGVAVIGGRGGKLILKEPSIHQTKFVENKLKKVAEELKKNECASSSSKQKGNEVAQVGERVLEHIGVTQNSSGKRKNLSYTDDVTESEEKVANNRRVKQKVQKETIFEPDLVTLDEERRCRTLFMGRLNFSISEDDVRKFFWKVARVNEVRFSKRKKGARFGHVEFYTAEAARQALKLNGHKLRGHVVNLDYAEKRPNLAEMFASSIVRNGPRDGSGGRHGGRGQGGFYGRGRPWGFGAGRGRHGGFGAGRVWGCGAGRGRREGRDW